MASRVKSLHFKTKPSQVKKLHFHYHVETQRQSGSLPHAVPSLHRSHSNAFPTRTWIVKAPSASHNQPDRPASRHTDNSHYSQRDKNFLQIATAASEKQRVSVMTQTIFFLLCRGQPDSDAVCWSSTMSKM